MSENHSQKAPSPDVHIVELRAINNGNLKGFATIKIGPLTVCDFRVIAQPGQRAYVSAPQIEYYDADGRRKYKPLCKYPTSWQAAIGAAILAALDEQFGVPSGVREVSL